MFEDSECVEQCMAECPSDYDYYLCRDSCEAACIIDEWDDEELYEEEW